MADIVAVDLTKKLPEKAVADSTYRIEGTVKFFDAVGTPPFVYAKIRRKEWYKPEVAEEVDYGRGWPVPLTGKFSLDFKPEKEGQYEVNVLATPALVPLPSVGVFPVLAESEVMNVDVGQKPSAVFRFSDVVVDGNGVHLDDHNADANLLIQKNTSDSLTVLPSYEWVGPSKTATISIKAGYRDFAGGFSPKTDAYTKTIELPESPDVPQVGKLSEPIKIPLTSAGDISDGAIEIVAKIPGESDYITHIWNVYRTKAPVVNFRFSDIAIDGNDVQLGNHDADSGLFLKKTTADYLDIVPSFEWQGPSKSAKISIKAGYKDFAGGFSPKTGEYTRSMQLPESIDEVYAAQATSSIRVPLTAAGGLDDGAVEIVLKISGEPDYISHIWNVYITKEAEEELQTLEVDITPAGSGYVTTSPSAESGPSQWVNGSTGKFPYGTRVMVTAHPNSGYEFDHWSDEIEGGTSTSNPAYVAGTMTEHRAVKAHFRQVAQPSQTLEVDITPAGSGYVTTSPQPETGPAQWTNGATGQFPYGTRVMVTAHPYSGYEFDHWSDEIEGGTSTSNPAYVAGTMTEHRAVKAHFRQIEQPPTAPPAADIRNFDFTVVGGTYKIGDKVSFSAKYEYKGKKQNGQLVISIGTGVYPSFFTKLNYNPSPLPFDECMDWTPWNITNGSFILTSALEPGQKYNVRARLETLDDQTQETDTDWGVIEIAPTKVSFMVGITGTPAFGSYQYWSCSYWDPITSSYASDAKWYSASAKISFSNVNPGGLLAVFLRRNGEISSQYNSPTFQPVNGKSYTYNVATWSIYG